MRKTIPLLLLLAGLIYGVGSASAKNEGVSQAQLPKLPVCHNADSPAAHTLLLPVKAAVNHLLPSLTDPTPSHVDGLGDCADDPLVLPPPPISLKHVQVPMCDVQDGAERQQVLSIGDLLYHVFVVVLTDDTSHTFYLGPCQGAPPLPPPPSPPPPTGGGDVPAP